MTANNGIMVIDIEEFFTRLEETLERKLKEREEASASQARYENMPEWLSRKQVASYFGLSLATIDNLTRAGILDKHYLGNVPRFNREEVRKAFESWKKYQRG